MGKKPALVLTGLIAAGLALPGCENCNCWGNKSHTVPPAYASGHPSAAPGQHGWQNRSAGQGVAATGQTQQPVSQVQPPAGPVIRTSTTGGNEVPPLPPQPSRGVVEKPLSYGEPTIRTTVPPSAEVPPPPEPASPTPSSAPVPPPPLPAGLNDAGGPSLSPPPLPQPPVPPMPSRPIPPQ
jgi:hypothetical protein